MKVWGWGAGGPVVGCSMCGFNNPFATELPRMLWLPAGILIALLLAVPVVLFLLGFRLRKREPRPPRWLAVILLIAMFICGLIVLDFPPCFSVMMVAWVLFSPFRIWIHALDLMFQTWRFSEPVLLGLLFCGVATVLYCWYRLIYYLQQYELFDPAVSVPPPAQTGGDDGNSSEKPDR